MMAKDPYCEIYKAVFACAEAHGEEILRARAAPIISLRERHKAVDPWLLIRPSNPANADQYFSLHVKCVDQTPILDLILTGKLDAGANSYMLVICYHVGTDLE